MQCLGANRQQALHTAPLLGLADKAMPHRDRVSFFVICDIGMTSGMRMRHFICESTVTCRFSNSVSYRGPLTWDNATCLTSCHPESVSDSCHFLSRTSALP